MAVANPEPIFIGQLRACHNVICGKSYTVENRTQYHCSDACAAECLKRRGVQ